MTTVVVAPDGFGGSLTADQAARAIAEGWASVRPDDELVLIPMSDGGEGLLQVIASPGDAWGSVEVADPMGRPVTAGLLVREDGTVVIESARACGLALVSAERRDPRLTTTYGVGELLETARGTGSKRILVGLGGSATVDGGAGALTALGFRPTVADGSGLKIGGGELSRVERITSDWVADWSDVTVELLADVGIPLNRSASLFGPQKGASTGDVELLGVGLERWAEVVERDLVPRGAGRNEGVAGGRLRDLPTTGAAGGLGFALMAGIGGIPRVGSDVVGELVDLPAAIAGADVVVTGEGRLDATTTAGKVVDHVTRLARARGLRVHAVVGQLGPGAPTLDDVQVASDSGPSKHPEDDLRAAAARSATVFGP